MLSSVDLHSLQLWSGRFGSLLRTNMALCTSFRHCLSSVGSERAVPNDLNILMKDIICGMRSRQALVQLGGDDSRCLAVIKEVML